MKNREKAIEWWNNLSYSDQETRKDKVIGCLIPMYSLTGIEVEFIFNFYHNR